MLSLPSSSSSSSSVSGKKYDVFLSFHGGDTPKTFIDHLYAALKRNGIVTFRDDPSLEPATELLKAIQESWCSLIVFSKTYGFSNWCLEELAEIVEQKKQRGHKIFPIFYEVDPSDLRKQKGSVDEAFARHEMIYKEHKDKVQRWRTAVTEVANIKGWHSSKGHESEFIEDIAKKVSAKLCQTYTIACDELIGIDSHLEELHSKIDIGEDDVRVIGICGVGGIGKTTLARVVFDQMSAHFEGQSFLADVREVSEKSGLVSLQKQLLSQILLEEGFNLFSVDDGKAMISYRLSRKKVLVVIDDADNLQHLKCLVGRRNWFGLGSRIIITTRDEHLLRSYRVDDVYKPTPLCAHEALQLFNLKAFNTKTVPENEFIELSKHVVEYANGLPLVLEVLGCFLSGRDVAQWRSAIERFKRDSNKEILDRLQISFDGLEETEKNIFLDIACFFNGEKKDLVIKILDDCEFYADIGIDVLVKKSLIKVDEDNKYLRMHSLLQEMGRKIVRQKSPNEPGRRCRLWEKKDICHVLTENIAMNAVEDMLIDYESVLCEARSLGIDRETSAKMQQSVPKTSGTGLTELLKEEEWAAKEIYLTDDKHRVSELPKSPNFPSFIEMYLQEKYELTAIPPLFFQRIALLQVLNLSHTSIKSLPKSLPKLVSLKKLLLRGCDLFMELSPQVGELEYLEELDLDETQIMDLPREIGKLVKLKHLRVSFYHICGKKKSKSNFVIHPETISNLLQLAELSIDVNPADKRWDDFVEPVVKELCNSKTLRTLSLYLPKFQLLDNTSLIYPSLSRFRFTVGHHKRRIISRVPHEVEADFRNWDRCLKFVNGENIPIEIKGVLKYSSSFFLDHHATAMTLSEFGIQNVNRLKFCLLAECNKMETLIDGDMLNERNEGDQSESDSGFVEHVLDSLEYLSIYYMENLWSIWRGPNRYGCMSKLKFLALHACPQLSNIFSHTLFENFVNLEEIILEDCPQVTSLVSHASGNPMVSGKFLPSLKRLLLLFLPGLVSISNGLLIAPKLESIGFYNCPKLKSISKMELSSKSLKMIKGESQWWEDMNWNGTEWGNRPDYLMRIFSPINNEKDVWTQFAEDRDLLEANIQNEGQQPDERKLLEVSTQDHKGETGQWSDYTKETKIGMDVIESTTSDSSKAPEQAWCFVSSEEVKRLEDDNVDEDEPKAKRCNSVETESKPVIGSAFNTARWHRFAFRTRSNVDVLDDGYRWRKYGKKRVKGNPNARSYYKCSTRGCPVKKRVERDIEDNSFLITTYEGVHDHDSPYDHRANNVENAAEAAKTISPRKGHGDVFEASLQDKVAHPEYAGIPEASVRDKSQQSDQSLATYEGGHTDAKSVPGPANVQKQVFYHARLAISGRWYKDIWRYLRGNRGRKQNEI